MKLFLLSYEFLTTNTSLYRIKEQYSQEINQVKEPEYKFT